MGIGARVAGRAGFFFGWWVAFASAGIVFLTGGPFFYGFGTLFDPLVDEFGWSHASISLGFSLRSEASGLAAPVIGILFDKLGARRLMATGVAIVSAGFFALSRAQNLWMFYGSVLIIAIGMSAAGGQVGFAAMAHWFQRKRGLALGVVTTGAGASGIMVLVMAGLISAFDWRTALAFMAAIQAIICIPLALSVRDKPSEMGLLPDGEEVEADQPQTARASKHQGGEGLTVKEALRSTAFWRLAIAAALVNLATTTIVVHQIPFFTSNVGISSGLAAASVTALTLLSVLGRFGFGYLADILDKRTVMAASYLVVAGAMLLFATIYEPWQIFIVLPVYAIGFGGTIPLRAAFQAEYFGTKAYGSIQGLVFTVGTIGGVTGPVLAGWLFDQTDTYRLVFMLLSVGALIAAPLILSIRKPAWSKDSLPPLTQAEAAG